MENDVENIEEIKQRISSELCNYTKQKRSNHEVLDSIVNHIRKNRELSEEMLNDIKEMDDNNKMILIKEYNKIIESLDRKKESIG